MKKRIISFLLIIILNLTNLFAQDIKGIWLSSYSREIQKRITKYSDTTYSVVYTIFDFIDNKNVVIKSINNSEKTSYTRENDIIKIIVNGEDLIGKIKDNQIILTYKNDSIEIKEIYFKRITSKLNQRNIPDSTYFHNSNWSVKTNNYSLNYGLNFDFLEKNKVIITQDFGKNGYTHLGSYVTDIYRNHFFIGIFDLENFEERIYCFNEKKNNGFLVSTYENKKFSPKVPIYNQIDLIKKEDISKKQWNLIESNLFGKWKAIGNPIPISPRSEYDSIKNQNLEIIFSKNHQFEIKYSGSLVKKDVEFSKERLLTGTWKLNETGKYIKLNSNIKWPDNFISIKELSKNLLKIYYDIWDLEGRIVSTKTTTLIR